MIMGIIEFLKRKSRKQEVAEFVERHYACVINDKMNWFDSKDEMLTYIEQYSKVNTIYKLSMFRYDMFNLIK